MDVVSGNVVALSSGPLYPNSIIWSEENLIAVSAGHLVGIYNPDSLSGPRGFIPLGQTPSLDLGIVKVEDLSSESLLVTRVCKETKIVVRSIAWSPQGSSLSGGCLLGVCTSDFHVKIYEAPARGLSSQWVEVLDVSKLLLDYHKRHQFEDAARGQALYAVEDAAKVAVPEWTVREQSKPSASKQKSSAPEKPLKLGHGVHRDPAGNSRSRNLLHLPDGTRVEVRDRHDGYKNIWYQATVVKTHRGQSLVVYDAENGEEKKMAWVVLPSVRHSSSRKNSPRIRTPPVRCPPPRVRGPKQAPGDDPTLSKKKGKKSKKHARKFFEPGDQVDAHIGNRWKEGQLVEMMAQEAFVLFPGDFEPSKFLLSDLRESFVWQDREGRGKRQRSSWVPWQRHKPQSPGNELPDVNLLEEPQDPQWPDVTIQESEKVMPDVNMSPEPQTLIRKFLDDNVPQESMELRTLGNDLPDVNVPHEPVEPQPLKNELPDVNMPMARQTLPNVVPDVNILQVPVEPQTIVKEYSNINAPHVPIGLVKELPSANISEEPQSASDAAATVVRESTCEPIDSATPLSVTATSMASTEPAGTESVLASPAAELALPPFMDKHVLPPVPAAAPSDGEDETELSSEVPIATMIPAISSKKSSAVVKSDIPKKERPTDRKSVRLALATMMKDLFAAKREATPAEQLPAAYKPGQHLAGKEKDLVVEAHAETIAKEKQAMEELGITSKDVMTAGRAAIRNYMSKVGAVPYKKSVRAPVEPEPQPKSRDFGSADTGPRSGFTSEFRGTSSYSDGTAGVFVPNSRPMHGKNETPREELQLMEGTFGDTADMGIADHAGQAARLMHPSDEDDPQYHDGANNSSVQPMHNGAKSEVPPSGKSTIPPAVFVARLDLMAITAIAWSRCNINGLASEDCSVLLLGSKSGHISLLQLQMPDSYCLGMQSKPVLGMIGNFQAHSAWVSAICCALLDQKDVSPDGFGAGSQLLLIASGGSDGSVKLWRQIPTPDLSSHNGEMLPFIMEPLAEVVVPDTSPVTSLALHLGADGIVSVAAGKAAGQVIAEEICLTSPLPHQTEACYSGAAHSQSVTGLLWADNPRCLYSCAQDNTLRCWSLSWRHLSPLDLPSDINVLHRSKLASHLQNITGAVDSFLGIAASPNGLALAAVRGVEENLVDRMYFRRAQRGLLQLLWLVGPRAKPSVARYDETYMSLEVAWRGLVGPEQEPSQNLQCQIKARLDGALEKLMLSRQPVVLWDVIAFLLLSGGDGAHATAVELLVKWGMPLMRVPPDAPPGSRVGPEEVSSRELQVANVLARRLGLFFRDKSGVQGAHRRHVSPRDQIYGVGDNSNVAGRADILESPEWAAIEVDLAANEHELRQRLALATMQRLTCPGKGPPPIKAAQYLANWVLTNPDGARVDIAEPARWFLQQQMRSRQLHDLMAIAAPSNDSFFDQERCPFCEATLDLSLPEVAVCMGPHANASRHSLRRCMVTGSLCTSPLVWKCRCCNRRATVPAPILTSPFEIGTNGSIALSRIRPECPFCGLLLHRVVPNTTLVPALV